MKNKKYGNTMALKEHLLKGHKVSRLESLLLFGVQNYTAVLTNIKRDGFILKSQKQTYYSNRKLKVLEFNYPNLLRTTR